MQNTAEQLAIEYERGLSQQDTKQKTDIRKKNGAFYTPVEIIDEMLGETLNGDVKTILDPAAGGGLFLMRAIRLIHRKKLSVSKLTACDIDSSALSVAESACKQLSAELYGSDTPPFALEFIHSDFLKHVADGNIDERFDLIISNPPFGISRDGKISKEELLFYATYYPEAISGRANKALLFVVAAARLMSATGQLSFVLPNSWLGIKEGTAFRSWLLNKNAAINIRALACNTFKDAGVETITLTLKNASADTLSINNNIFKREFIASLPGMNFPLLPTALDGDDIGAKLELLLRKTIQLKNLFTPKIAMQVYRTGGGNPPQTADIVKNHPFHSKTKSGDEWVPYIEGRDLTRYAINWSGTYLKYGPWIAEYSSLEYYKQPRILLREILNPQPYPIIAAYTEELLTYNKSILHILGGNREQLLVLTAILNSAKGGEIIRLLGRKAQRRVFPKIVLDDLKNFPLPPDFDLLVSKLIQPAKLLATSSKEQTNDIQGDINAEIDEIINNAYSSL